MAKQLAKQLAIKSAIGLFDPELTSGESPRDSTYTKGPIQSLKSLQ